MDAMRVCRCIIIWKNTDREEGVAEHGHHEREHPHDDQDDAQHPALQICVYGDESVNQSMNPVD